MFQDMKAWFSRLMDFGDVVVAGLREAGVSEQDMNEVATKFVASPAQLKNFRQMAVKFGGQFAPKPEARIVKSLRLVRRFETTEEVLDAGQYAAGHDSYITDATYPMRQEMQDETELVFLDFLAWSCDPSTAEIYAEADRLLGHHEVAYEDALRCGAESLGEQYSWSFVFLHEADADGDVLYLARWGGGRRLGRGFGSPGSCWDRGRCLFAFRRNKRA